MDSAETVRAGHGAVTREIPIRQAARQLGKSRQWLMRMIAQGRLRARRRQRPRGPYWMVVARGGVVEIAPPKRSPICLDPSCSFCAAVLAAWGELDPENALETLGWRPAPRKRK